jgi:hypothetical protein
MITTTSTAPRPAFLQAAVLIFGVGADSPGAILGMATRGDLDAIRRIEVLARELDAEEGK